MRRTAFGDLLLADDQRRQEPHDVVAGRDGQQFFAAQCVDKLAAWRPVARSPSSSPSPRTSAMTRGTDP